MATTPFEASCETHCRFFEILPERIEGHRKWSPLDGVRSRRRPCQILCRALGGRAGTGKDVAAPSPSDWSAKLKAGHWRIIEA
jgi:hypothetical protein